jgi:hypothetical protein
MIILYCGAFIMMNLTYSIERSSSMVENLSKEGMAVMDVFKNMSHRFIEKDEWLMNGVMDSANVANYPLDWTQLSSGIEKFSDVASSELTASNLFGGNSVASTQMTYMPVNNDSTNDFTLDERKRLNILNEVWKKVNLVRLGYEFDVNITSTFFMIKNTNDNKEIIATFPGQNASVSTFTTYDFYNEAMLNLNTSEYVTIPLQSDPFSTGIPKIVGYCKGFNISGKYEGVTGIFYNSELMKNLLVPVAEKAEKMTFSLYQVTSSGDVLLATTDTDKIIEGSGDVLTILDIPAVNDTLVIKDVIKSGDEYLLTEFSERSGSGAVYKAAGIYGPYYKKAESSAYDWRAIFLQDNDVLVEFYKKLQDDIQSEFALIYGLIPFYCIVLCIILGIIMYFCVLRPIKELAKAAKGKI